MSLLLNCQEVHKSIGPQTLFSSLSFTVNRGDRLAVIGANGSGKTTLLRMLAGMDTPDGGRISYAQNMVVGFLHQQDSFDPGASVLEVLLHGLQDTALDDLEKHNRAHAMLSRAGFQDPDTFVHSLSGGWRKRLAVALTLANQPDLLILDEPTNHLDLEGIIWLENLLHSKFPGCPSTFIIVSHDRIFLENIATRIIEIAPVYPEGYFQVDGNYSSFLKRKEDFVLQQQEKQARLANQVNRETEWLNRGPKARTTKARFRVNEAQRLTEELTHLRSRNRSDDKLDLDFVATGRKTKKLLEAVDIAKEYNDRPLFSGLDLVLSPGRRIGLLGSNGSGKSTLMRILVGATDRKSGLAADRGTIRTADDVRIVYFAQGRQQLDTEQTLRHALSPEGDSILYRGQSVHVVTWAHKFLFRTDQLDTPVANLSGGEQARILIAGLMREPADILLLDEPTNDLDIPSLTVLEESLLDFPGAVVLVSHDRYLLNRICDYMLGFDGQGGVERFADFEQWHRSMAAPQKPDSRDVQKTEKISVDQQAGRLSYLDQREYDAMEDLILELEEKEQGMLVTLENPENAADHALLQETWQKLETVRLEIDRMYARWDELETKKKSGN